MGVSPPPPAPPPTGGGLVTRTSLPPPYPASKGPFDRPRKVGKRKNLFLFPTFLGRSMGPLLAGYLHPFFQRSTSCAEILCVSSSSFLIRSTFSMTILVLLWFIVMALVFFYFYKLLFSGFLHLKGNFVRNS